MLALVGGKLTSMSKAKEGVEPVVARGACCSLVGSAVPPTACCFVGIANVLCSTKAGEFGPAAAAGGWLAVCCCCTVEGIANVLSRQKGGILRQPVSCLGNSQPVGNLCEARGAELDALRDENIGVKLW